MNSRLVYACTICFTAYDTMDAAINCAINECKVVDSQYMCSECDTYFREQYDADFCCSDEDTIERRAQFDEAMPEIEDVYDFVQ